MLLNLIVKSLIFLFFLSSCKESSLINFSLQKKQQNQTQDDGGNSGGGSSGGTDDVETYFSAQVGGVDKLYAINREGEVNVVGNFPSEVQVVDQYKWNEKIYFSLKDVSENLAGGNNAELWAYNPSSKILGLVLDVNGNSSLSSEPSNFTTFQNKLFFSAFDGSQRFIYSYDGSQVSKISGSYSDAAYLTTFQNAIYFSALSPANGYELFRYNGSNVTMIKDFSVGARGTFPQNFIVQDNKLYYVGTKLHKSGTLREGLFVYDGNEISSLVNSTNEYYKDLYYSNKFGFFVSCYFPNSGSTPCRFNPVTNQATSIFSSSRSMKPTGFIEFNGSVYFSAFTIENGFELYRYNGTNSTLVMDIYPGNSSSTPSDFFIHGNYLYFSATTSTNGSELWRVGLDGSVKLHKDLNPGTGSSYPRGGEHHK